MSFLQIRTKKLSTKILISVLSSFAVVFAIIIAVIAYRSFQEAKDSEYKFMQKEGESIANRVDAEIEVSLDAARTLAHATEGLVVSKQQNRAIVIDILKNILDKNEGFLGAWVVFEPNAFDGQDTAYLKNIHSDETGRFVPYVNRLNGNIAVEKCVDYNATTQAGDYYNISKNSGEEYVANPYAYEVQGKMTNMVSCTVPMIVDGKTIGVAGIDISEDKVDEIVNKIKILKSGYAFLLSNNGLIASHPNPKFRNTFFIDSDKETLTKLNINAKIKEGENIQYEKVSPNTGITSHYIHTSIQFGSSKHFWSVVVSAPQKEIVASAYSTLYLILFMGFLGVIIISITLFYIAKSISKPIEMATERLSAVALGNIDESKLLLKNSDDEVGQMVDSVNSLIKGLSKTAVFAGEIGKGNLEALFEPLSNQDTLGNALIEMRSSLVKATHEEEIRKKDDEQRNWSTEGFAKFGEILRQNNDNMEKLSFNIIRNLVEYTGMNQGGLFIYNDNSREHPFLEMTSCYAFNRQKFLHKSIEIGEGLVGACYQEGKTIYLTEVPNSYIDITSGLGEANPSCILIVPLKVNDEIFGIIELASFKNIEPHEIEFVEKVGESIASTISSVKVNIRTAQLLEVSQQQSEEMRAQEEEMRQNMEEMHATQEELQRKEQMTTDMVEKMRVQEAELKENLAAMSEKEKYTQDLIETMKQQEEELRQNMEEVHATQEELGRKDLIQQEEIARLNAENEKRIKEIAVKEEQMRGVLETCLDGVIIIDNHGFIEFFNQSAENLWGYNRNEVIGKNVKMLMGTEHSSNHDAYMHNYATTGVKKVIGSGREVQLIRKDGSKKDIFLSLVETKFTGGSRFTGFVRDLSVQKKNEEERNSLMEQIIAKEMVYEKRIADLDKKLASKSIVVEEVKIAPVIEAAKSTDKLMTWSDSDFSVKVEEIDAQHKKLVDLINDLYSAFQKGQAKNILGDILNELINYTANHFATEEKYFAQFAYPEAEIHIDLHKKLVESVLAFKADFETGKATVSYDLMNFLKDWLVGHIQGTDRKYSEWFKNNGL
ncbi:MAG: bacteriohemerythrin [Bacteroidota bacterium]